MASTKKKQTKDNAGIMALLTASGVSSILTIIGSIAITNYAKSIRPVLHNCTGSSCAGAGWIVVIGAWIIPPLLAISTALFAFSIVKSREAKLSKSQDIYKYTVWTVYSVSIIMLTIAIINFF